MSYPWSFILRIPLNEKSEVRKTKEGTYGKGFMKIQEKRKSRRRPNKPTTMKGKITKTFLNHSRRDPFRNPLKRCRNNQKR
jgi:hypothetical protein